MSLRALYLDTSVVGGYFDKEYQKESRQLGDLWKSGRYRFVSSVVVEEEIEPAPEQVRRLYAQTFPGENRLALSMAAIELAGLYIQQGLRPNIFPMPGMWRFARWPGSRIWSAGTSGTWNVEREAGFNAINLLQATLPSV